MCTCGVKLRFPYKVNAPPKGHAAVAGFHTDGGGGGLEFLPPPPEILEIEYGFFCFFTGIKQQSCPRFRQKQSERI